MQARSFNRDWADGNNREAGDLVVTDPEVAGEDQLVGQVRLVVGPVDTGTDNDVAVVVEDFADLHRDVVPDHLFGHEGTDRIGAPHFPTDVVDVGVGGEGGDDPVEVEGVDGRDELGHHTSEFGGNGHGFLPCSDRPP